MKLTQKIHTHTHTHNSEKLTNQKASRYSYRTEAKAQKYAARTKHSCPCPATWTRAAPRCHGQQKHQEAAGTFWVQSSYSVVHLLLQIYPAAYFIISHYKHVHTHGNMYLIYVLHM